MVVLSSPFCMDLVILLLVLKVISYFLFKKLQDQPQQSAIILTIKI
jgi:hypothetical protein